MIICFTNFNYILEFIKVNIMLIVDINLLY